MLLGLSMKTGGIRDYAYLYGGSQGWWNGRNSSPSEGYVPRLDRPWWS